MILKRTAEAIRNQDWFTVFVEFVLVVFGVLVALEVDRWNESWKEARLEKGYLERLEEDFIQSRQATRAFYSFHKRQIDGLALVMKALETCGLDEENRETFATTLFNMGKVNEPILIRRTINELEAEGGFQTIQNNEIKRLINSAVGESEQVARVYDSLLARITPSVNRLGQHIRFNYPSDNPEEQIGWKHLILDFDSLCDNPSALADLSYIRVNSHNIQQFFIRLLNRYSDVLAALKEAQGKDVDNRKNG